MKYLTSSLALAAVASAAEVNIAWRHDRNSDESSIGVFDASTKVLLADSCGTVVQADVPIDFSHVHLNGTSGYWSVGKEQYSIHSKPESGPACTQKFNSDFVLIECTGVDWTPSSIPASLASEKECFSDVNMGHHFRRMEGRVTRRAPVEERTVSVPKSPKWSKRQGTGTCQSQTTKELAGDGSPYQSYLYTQLSESIACNNAQACSASQSNSKSFTIGWSVSDDLGGLGWLSGGFDVSKSWETGNEYVCQAGSNEEVCIWYSTYHTACKFFDGLCLISYVLTNRHCPI